MWELVIVGAVHEGHNLANAFRYLGFGTVQVSHYPADVCGNLVRDDPAILGTVQASQHGLEVRPVKAHQLVFWISEIELAARDDVVDVPNGAVVFEGHAFCEIELKPLLELG
jgi:hypothetical protein